jgi:hypothetical protein
MVEIHDSGDVLSQFQGLKQRFPHLVASVRVEMTSTGVGRVVDLANSGVEVIHMVADINGNEMGTENPRFIKDLIRQVHTELITTGVRDNVTLIAGGGIALAEHMAKAVLCGADLVSTCVPLILALECRMCSLCIPGLPCPARLEALDFGYAAGRIRNLIASWHLQLIELMGAMGMREARRLRGDVGRAMFFEELEEEIFGTLFGSRK